ncbi:21 kDa protein-like [Malania oleifera]|uniref:21 kDa protein-like n=1 Tax=Malania oleifera TaxID=397392 RepID=UPI0025AE54A5|nr:21 kDa protein-like [Malania oleifera]
MGFFQALPFLLSLLLITSSADQTFPSGRHQRGQKPHKPDDHSLKMLCMSSTFPEACCDSLRPFAYAVQSSRQKLVDVSLSVSVKAACSTSDFLKHCQQKYGGGPLKDCITTVADSVDRLKQSLRELKRLIRDGSDHAKFHLQNIQTWASAALTDDQTCLDGVKQGGAKAASPVLRAKVKVSITKVAELTSNALYFINKFNVTS